jgi:hypothetical protein
MSDDDRLSGFLDRELDAQQLAEMRSHVAGDVATNAKVERMSRNDDLIRAAFDGPMRERLPDRFNAAIDRGLAPIIVPLVDTIPQAVAVNDNAKGWWRASGVIAASLVLGVLLGTQLMPNSDHASALNLALDSTPSAQTTLLESGQSLTPQISFARVGGGYCRSFTLAKVGAIKAGLACKAGQTWSIEALIPAAGAAGSAEQGYVLAEGPVAPGLDAIIDDLRAGDPMDKAAELAMIARSWE